MLLSNLRSSFPDPWLENTKSAGGYGGCFLSEGGALESSSRLTYAIKQNRDNSSNFTLSFTHQTQICSIFAQHEANSL